MRQVYLMQRLLEGQGLRVLMASDGPEAVNLNLRHKEEIAVAILDLGLRKFRMGSFSKDEDGQSECKRNPGEWVSFP